MAWFPINPKRVVHLARFHSVHRVADFRVEQVDSEGELKLGTRIFD